jgi:hypothetical protein
MTLKPIPDKIAIGCNVWWQDKRTNWLDIDMTSDHPKLEACCPECLINAAELLAVCERERRHGSK